MQIKFGKRYGTPRSWVRRCNAVKGDNKYSLVIAMTSKVETIKRKVEVDGQAVELSAKVTKQRKAKVYKLDAYDADLTHDENRVRDCAGGDPIFETSSIRCEKAPLRPVVEALFGEVPGPVPAWLKG